MPIDVTKDLQGRFNRANALLKAGKRDEAVRAAGEMVSAAKAHLGERHPVVEEALRLAADFHEAAGNLSETERLLREALAVRRFFVGQRDIQLVSSLSRLAAVNLALDRHSVAEPLVRESLEICRSLNEKDRVLEALPLRSLAQVRLAAGRPSEALASVREAMRAAEGFDESAANNRKDFTASAHMVECEACEKLGDLDGAEAALRAAAGLYGELYGAGNPAVVSTNVKLAEVLAELGEADEADAMYVACADNIRSVIGEFSPDFCELLLKIAGVRAIRGHPADADRLIGTSRRLLDISPESEPLARVMHSVAAAVGYAPIEQWERGSAMSSEAIARLRPEGRIADPVVCGELATWSAIRVLLGETQAAARDILEALTIARGLERNREETLATCLSHAAMVLGEAGRYKESEELSREFVELRRASDGSESALYFLALDALADSLEDEGRDEEAIVVSEQSVVGLSGLLGEDHPLTSRPRGTLLWILGRQGQWERAAELLSLVTRVERVAYGLLSANQRPSGMGASLIHVRAETAMTVGVRDPARAWVGLEALLRCRPMMMMQLGVRRPIALTNHRPEHVEAVRKLRRLDSQVESLGEADEHPEPRLGAERWAMLSKEREEAARSLESAAPEMLFAELGARHGVESYVRALGAAATLACFARVCPAMFGALGRGEPSFGSPRYLCAVVAEGRASLIELDSCSVIDGLVDAHVSNKEGATQALAASVLGSLKLRGGQQVVVVPDGRLGEVDWPRLVREHAPSGVGSVRLLSSPWGVLGEGPSLSAAAAEKPVVVGWPDLDGVGAATPESDVLQAPARRTLWRQYAERAKLIGAPKPLGMQVQLEGPLFRRDMVSHGLEADRAAIGLAPAAAAERSIRAAGVKALSGTAANVRAVTMLRSPRWLVFAGPWGLLPDEWLSHEHRDRRSMYRVLPRPASEDESKGPESPLLRAGVYLHGASEASRGGGAALSAYAMSGMDLSQTKCVVFATPPRTPEGGSVSVARQWMVRALHWAGARCVVVPRAGADAGVVDERAAELIQQLVMGDCSTKEIADWVAQRSSGVLDVYEQFDESSRLNVGSAVSVVAASRVRPSTEVG